jgi:hypothetical protein
LDFDRLINEPTVLVVRLNEASVRRLRPLTNAFFSELVAKIFHLAERSPGGVLPRLVSLIIEEFASAVGRIPDFDRFANTVRTRGVSVTASVQSIAQIRKEYGDEADSLLAGFCTKMFFPNLTISDAEYASSLFGNVTVEYREKTVHREENAAYTEEFATDESVKIVKRPLLTPHEIRRPCRHAELGAAITLDLPDVPGFQAFVTPAYQLAKLSAVMKKAASKDKLGQLRAVALPEIERRQVAVNADMPKEAEMGAISNTTGWTNDQVERQLETVKQQLNWEKTEGSARQWWETFEKENRHRLALVLRLAEELRNRSATITEFHLAYVFSECDNIQANLHYLDYTRLKNKEAQKRKERQCREATDAATSPEQSNSALGDRRKPTPSPAEKRPSMNAQDNGPAVRATEGTRQE